MKSKIKIIAITLLPLFGVLVGATAKPSYALLSNSEVSLDSISVCNDQKEKFPIDAKLAEKALVVINGKEYPSIRFNMLDTMYIESVSVLDSKKAMAQHGTKGTNGIIYVTLKEGYDYSALENNPPPHSTVSYIIDDKESSEEEFKKLGLSQILSMDVSNENNMQIIRVKTK